MRVQEHPRLSSDDLFSIYQLYPHCNIVATNFHKPKIVFEKLKEER